jgi:hypothetical protein
MALVDKKNDAIPVLSVCMAGRDDEYMLDFKYRLTTTLDFYACSMERLGRLDEIELIVTDWGSPRPLAESLVLSQAAQRIARFIYVPPEAITRTQNGQTYYHIARSLNVGLRRSRGQYVFLTNTDQLVPTTAMESLMRFLRGEVPSPVTAEAALMVVPRVQVPWQFVETRPTFAEWEKFMFVNEYALVHEPLPPFNSWFGGTSGYIFAHDTNAELRGFDERQPGWGFGDVEFGFRAIQDRPFVFLSNLGIRAFHMGHPPAGSRESRLIVNNLDWDATLQRNDADWGLGQAPLVDMRATTADGIEHTGQARIPSAETSNPSVAMQGQRNIEHIRLVLSRVATESSKLAGGLYAHLYFLSWHSLYCFPKRYLELGLTGPESSAIVVSACPSVEICAARAMSGAIPGNRIPSLLSSLTALGHHGYFHLLNGPIAATVMRLPRLAEVFESFDLVFIEVGDTEPIEPGILSGVLGVVSATGAVVLKCNSPTRFEALWNELGADGGRRLFRARAEPVGMIVNGSVTGKPDRVSSRETLFDFRPPEAMIPSDPPVIRESLIRVLLKEIWRLVLKLHRRLEGMK